MYKGRKCIWQRTTQIAREETCCHHIGYSFRLAARVLLYAPSHRQDNTYHGLCYTSRGALAGTRICTKRQTGRLDSQTTCRHTYQDVGITLGRLLQLFQFDSVVLHQGALLVVVALHVVQSAQQEQIMWNTTKPIADVNICKPQMGIFLIEHLRL